MRGGVSLLVINTSRDASHALALPIRSERYTLQASKLESKSIELNGRALALDARGALPHVAGTATRAGVVTFAPATISFLLIPQAANRACR